MKKFLSDHSMSIFMTVLWVVFSWLGWYVAKEDNHWLYDWSLSMAGIFGGVAALMVFGHFLWERDADPNKPPKKH